ncbi:MAG: AMP-binding protein, partial [Oscillospiraceae bacterium]|nr:AMP-binding protein [Oscillospiraceae bacterium]MBQ3987080.1 AMP-binding protein [Oscillospiraceae bacterium]
LAEMALALSKKFRRNMLGDSLKYIICGAASVPPYLIKEYAALGIDLYPGYGLTESSNLVSGNVSPLEKPDSVGLPYPNQELKIVDGELLIRGDNMMDGYIGEDEAGVWEDGWFKTGDLARIDEDGFIYITGRKKEIIVLPTGENISPAELEAKFNECSLVADSQVFEDKNEAGRHFLALEVVPRAAEMAKLPADDAPAILMSELNAINSKLPAFQRVSRIEIRDRDFERTKSLKIVRYKKCE